MKSPIQSSRHQGFALVITLSLMILLTVIAVGLLTLSAISLRASSQGQAMAEARANARLGLMLAIGDLQKSLGPDRAVSASSEVLTASPAKPQITGVWESWWDFDPSKSPNYASEKTKRFRRWLVSSADPSALETWDFATADWSGKTIELVGNASLGGKAPSTAKVIAGLVPVARAGKIQGAYAWHVADEALKARVNLYRDPDQNTTLAQKRALPAGHRPDPSLMTGADGKPLTGLPTDLTAADFAKAKDQTGKIIDLYQIELLDAAKGRIKQFRNDITPYSLGLLTDVRRGGLKQDLSSMFEMGSATATTLPAEFANRKLYQTTHGISGTSDPYWSALAAYYNSFRSLATPESTPTFAVTAAAAITDAAPKTYNPAPVIEKVDTIFSLVSRPFDDFTWVPRDTYDYMVSLIFTPVVTLHNPYNVNLSFHSMKVTFLNVPIAFQFMLQKGGTGPFESQSVETGKFESPNTMIASSPADRGDKTFEMNIANWSNTGSAISGPIVMKPGQTLVCGPYFDPNGSFKNDTGAGGGPSGVAFDWQNKLTNSIKAKPSFTPGLGFETVAVNIKNLRTGINWFSICALRDSISPVSSGHVTDNFYIEFQAQRPSWYLNDTPGSTSKNEAAASFEVSAQLQATSSSSPIVYAKLKFDYQSDATLQNVFNNRVYRYPPTAPTDSLTGHGTAAPGGILYSEQAPYLHPFAVMSAYARTTNGGVYETGKRSKGPGDSPQINLLKDGVLAGKPFLFHNPTRANMTMNLASEKPGAQAYELNMQPFLSKGDYQDYMDVENNRVPALTGNKTSSGIKSGSYLEIPSGPLQTIADFRRSNALTTTYLPHFVQPVGNSRLHPLMSADKVVETNSSMAATALLDHSVLANHALYDRFYFSTFATRGSTKPDTVFEQFMNGSAPLAAQSFQPYQTGGKSVTDAKAELFAAGKPKDSAYKTAAEYQLIRGPFNVNSTSVQAWKTVLAAMNKSAITTLWARTAGLETKTSDRVPILAMSLPNGGAIPGAAVDANKIDNLKTNTWNGYRELSESELENLALKIVAEVRERGPFLSMSEFVNRQVGPAGPRTLAGALEAAITESEINEKKNAVSPDSFLDQVPITATDLSDTKLYNYTTPEATTGNPAAGAPGWVNQADLLRILEPAATVRADTFVIRVCGEAWDPVGKVIARAYAEAVVQRMPEYVDPADRPSLNAYTDPTAAKANKTFGRRINLVAFRWLSSHEI